MMTFLVPGFASIPHLGSRLAEEWPVGGAIELVSGSREVGIVVRGATPDLMLTPTGDVGALEPSRAGGSRLGGRSA
jgi:hypothetical protein